MAKTFEELAADKDFTVYVDRFEDSVRVLVLKGTASLCAYLGIPSGHPLAGNEYDDLPIQCNGGLTSGREGKNGSPWAEGYYWYGWDYAHCDDASFCDLKYKEKITGKKWTVEEVEKEIWWAVYGLKKLMKIAERATRHMPVQP